jgi:Ca-activated chloride channel family protein
MVGILRRTVVFAAVALGALLLFAQSALADGIVIPDPIEPIPPDHVVVPFLPIKYHRVEVVIDNQVAQVEIDQAFLNEGDFEVEATYIFPLPEDAAISDFAMYVDGERLEGRILDKEKARAIYEDIVRRREDPALLEYVGRNMFQAQVFPIPPHSERRIQIAYTQVLSQEGGLVRFVYPLNTEKFSPRPLEEVTISVDVRSDAPIKAFYSPSHDIAISRQSETHVTASYEDSDVIPNTDFELFYSLSSEDIGASLITYRQGDEDGFFLLLVAPKGDLGEQEVVAKDVMVVLDVSGSMSGEKLEQAQEAVQFILDHLNPEDRFNILAFSTSVDLYASTLQSASRAEDAEDFVQGLSALGGTNINDALLEALDRLPGQRPEIIIFLTDGLPTVGIEEEGPIIANVREAAGPTVRLFAFGVGDDVNTVLLDSIAQENRGTSAYVRPGEDIAQAVSGFYEKVSTPVLADISLDFGDINVLDVYPQPLPDLFVGSQLVVVGRYRGEGTVTLELSGVVNGEEQSFSYGGQVFPGESSEMDFLPRLWATRKIGYLLNQIRLYGSEQELVDEIVDLSLRYGVMTPYTSFLVEEEVEIFSYEGREKAASDLGQALAPALAPETGAYAVDSAETIEEYRQAEAAAGSGSASARVVGDKTFVQRDDAWIDSSYQEGMDVTKIGYGSDNYYDLLGERPDWGAYFALGEHVIFLADGQAYEVSEGDYAPVEVTPTPEATPTPNVTPNPDVTPSPEATPTPDVTPTPDPVLPALAQDDGGTNWALVAAAIAVGAVVLVVGGLVVWSRVRRGEEGSQS